MEIDKAIKESDDRRLITKYNNAIYVIQRALSLYKFEEVAFSFNGGKDSTVLLHLLRAGYFLHIGKSEYTNGNPANCNMKCTIRTIYFETPSAFPEINSFTHETAATYGLQMETIRLDFKSGLEALLKEKPTKAIFLGTRIGDPNAVGQEQFSPSSPGWPPFMRVNPILDWSYRDIWAFLLACKIQYCSLYDKGDIWAFLLACKIQYCSLYDKGYTSIGSIYDTVPNSLLCTSDSSSNKGHFKPAYLLADGRLERAGRAKRYFPLASEGGLVASNGPNSVESRQNNTLTASVITLGDEILFGFVEDKVGFSLLKKLHSIGWTTSQVSFVRNDIDSVAEVVEKQKSANDMVFIIGGVGSLASDVSVAGVAKAFGVRLAPDEEFEEYLRHAIADHCMGHRNEMARLPEGITELLHHESLQLPLIKCQNVVILSATNLTELDNEWNCLLGLASSGSAVTFLTPFVSKHLSTTLTDVETAQPLSKLCLEFPDVYVGGYRKSRVGSLIISFVGKDSLRVELAVQAFCQRFSPGSFYEVNCG
ncbi:Fad synthase [Thalictrum thalictroides]|uniref:FAD synthase n=1 Tax=Thalictrum thalictroides TaxID=46969 RepID=A0A7J6W0X6_THATH|nr:Fad synthase [Thalictrum thalictroides]